MQSMLGNINPLHSCNNYMLTQCKLFSTQCSTVIHNSSVISFYINVEKLNTFFKIGGKTSNLQDGDIFYSLFGAPAA